MAGSWIIPPVAINPDDPVRSPGNADVKYVHVQVGIVKGVNAPVLLQELLGERHRGGPLVPLHVVNVIGET
jgi:hypothetical protein